MTERRCIYIGLLGLVVALIGMAIPWYGRAAADVLGGPLPAPTLSSDVEAMSTIEDRERDLVIRTQRGEGDEVRVAVQDSGIGFEPRSAERMFDAFHTTKPGGLGMGLSISRSIVESHGGRLWAVPNDGPGATFQFTFHT